MQKMVYEKIYAKLDLLGILELKEHKKINQEIENNVEKIITEVC